MPCPQVDIWDVESLVSEETDGSGPQAPKFTQQFTNTLKHNKGHIRKSDFDKISGCSPESEEL
eukprot:CAMPEP_0196994336 /NCGR_PEP_ID=MMETSP1380-20130617/642_1 /TAXON_ID=5936 /ORGANISM="Euplotes crassus, Strain CT5" /LENGTH=62 /DNA_ID=CAMNT_0042409677 /DNA_START=34 /DNA_END=222 /DNA_ORIENTATION=+